MGCARFLPRLESSPRLIAFYSLPPRLVAGGNSLGIAELSVRGPYSATSIYEWVMLHHACTPRSLRRGACHRSWREPYDRMLATRPEQRQQTMREVILDLRTASHSLRGHSTPAGDRRRSDDPAGRWSQRCTAELRPRRVTPPPSSPSRRRICAATELSAAAAELPSAELPAAAELPGSNRGIRSNRGPQQQSYPQQQGYPQQQATRPSRLRAAVLSFCFKGGSSKQRDCAGWGGAPRGGGRVYLSGRLLAG